MVEFDGGRVCLDMIVLVNGNSLLRSLSLVRIFLVGIF